MPLVILCSSVYILFYDSCWAVLWKWQVILSAWVQLFLQTYSRDPIPPFYIAVWQLSQLKNMKLWAHSHSSARPLNQNHLFFLTLSTIRKIIRAISWKLLAVYNIDSTIVCKEYSNISISFQAELQSDIKTELNPVLHIIKLLHLHGAANESEFVLIYLISYPV